MNITDLQQNMMLQFCFPGNNASCRKQVRAGPGYILLFILLSCVSVCTVFLNLLVIISISHFKQLHTPTNLLILSLAVADLLVGLFVMPVKIMELIDSCWYLGKIACAVSPLINAFSMAGSLCSLTLISVDRYIAINDPLLYSTRVTVCKMSVTIIVGWSLSLFYVINYFYFNDHLLPSQISFSCYGECVVSVKYSWVIIDLVVFFLAPCFVIILLYSIIFNVARRQAKAVRAAMSTSANKHRTKVSSETKAAKTLGIVIFVYLFCWFPCYVTSLSMENLTSLSVAWVVFFWLIYINSSVNPLIYAIFYSWFRKSVKLIVSCRILESSSSGLNLFPE